ncbi:MAG: hydroxyphenylacetyl-CoA thioesterase PaaI [Gammaproteobacteria bacterium]|nr:hydroxyphenylacetyl-CoA thioesterase PaaI [Gammaproteobacteria bacterium]
MADLEQAVSCAAQMYASDAASQMLGIEVDIPAVGEAVARMSIRDDMLNGFGVCHGGFIFALADTAFAFACNAYNRQAVAASAQIEFLRPAHLDDRLTATVTEDYLGRKRAYYRVVVNNQADQTVALFQGRSVSNETPLLEF